LCAEKYAAWALVVAARWPTISKKQDAADDDDDCQYYDAEDGSEPP
jgi:hypothetical protein